MSHEDQTKEGCVYAFRRHLSSRGRRGKACQKAPMRETLQQDKEHGAAHTQEGERQQRSQEGLRNQGGGLPVLPESRAYAPASEQARGLLWWSPKPEATASVIEPCGACTLTRSK